MLTFKTHPENPRKELTQAYADSSSKQPAPYQTPSAPGIDPSAQ